MGENFWWIYDIICVLIIGFSVYINAKKGFSETLILILGCIIAVFLSLFVSQKSANFLYNSFVKKSSIESVKEVLEDYSPALSVKEAVEGEDYGAILEEGKVKKMLQSDDSVEMIYEYTNQAAGDIVDTHDNFIYTLTRGFSENFGKQIGVKLPPYAVRELTEKMTGNDKLFVETTKLLVNSPNKVPEYIEENYIRQPALKLVRAFVFIICYFIIMLIVRTVIYKTVKFGLLNGYDRLDHTVGGIVGLVQAAATLIIAAVLVEIMIQVAESDGSFFNYKTVEHTKLFKYVFDFIEKY